MYDVPIRPAFDAMFTMLPSVSSRCGSAACDKKYGPSTLTAIIAR